MVLDPWRQVTVLAGRQMSLVSSRDLDHLRVGLALRRTWLRQGRLSVERPGVFRIAGAARTWRSGVLGATMAAGPDAVASHLTAAALHGLGPTISEAVAPVRVATRPFHVTSPRRLRLDDVAGHIHRLDTSDRAVSGGVPVTSLERTLWDLATMFDAAVLGRCVDEGIRRGACLETLRCWAERNRGGGRLRRWPMRQVLGERLPDFDPGANPWEQGWDRWWEQSGLPEATRQYPVVVAGRRYVLDRAIPALKLGVEWNGYAYHGRRSNFDRDSFRRADLMAAGWELIEVTSNWDPERLVAVVTAVVDRRRREMGADPP